MSNSNQEPTHTFDGRHVFVVEMYGNYNAICLTSTRAFEIRDELIENELLEEDDLQCIRVIMERVDKII